MATFPDIIGEYMDAKERYAASGLQYAGYFDPPTISPGQVTNFFLFLQNMVNVPIEANLKIIPPQTGGFLRSKNPMLETGADEINIKLGAAEVGLLSMPVTTTEHVESGRQELGIEAKVASQGKGERVRPEKSQSLMEFKLIDSPVGLGLVGAVGATYAEKNAKKSTFALNISEKPGPVVESPNLEHHFEIVWKRQHTKFFTKAVQEIHTREIKIKKELTQDAIYANLYSESTHRFADAGLPLRIGEAIILAKILTFSCQYFLQDPHRMNGLLVPIWEDALEIEEDTTDSLRVIRTLGYYHLLKLSIATGFGIIRQTFGREFWSQTERMVVTDHIAHHIDSGQPLEVDFLYLPLLMAGTQICDKIKLQGENIDQSIALIKKARQARTELFADSEMAQPNKIFNRILKKAG